MIKSAIYTRVSTQEQAKEGYSIGEQAERLKAYCGAMGWAVYNTYTDAGYSGANIDRPGLQALITDAKNHKVDKVVVYKLDRLSRSQKDALFLIEDVFLKNGVDFVSITENFNTSTPFGKAALGIAACFAQLEREQIRERMMMGIDAMVMEGKWHGGIIPYGYDYKDKLLVVNESEAAQIREMYRLFVNGMALSQIEKEFFERGYTNRNGRWTLYRIRYIIANRLYAGYVKRGDEWIKAVHEPIIDEDTFNKAAAILQQNRDAYFSNEKTVSCGHKSTYLGGLIYCARCGARYGKSKSGKTGERYATYCCYSRIKVNRAMVRDPNCRNKIYPVAKLDKIVFDAIREIGIEQSPPEHEEEPDTLPILLKEIDKINTQSTRLIDLYTSGAFTRQQLDDKAAELQNRKEKVEKQIKDLSERKLTVTQAVELSLSFDAVLKSNDFHAVRHIIEQLIDHIDIDGEDVRIYWRL